jgi:threonine synthase
MEHELECQRCGAVYPPGGFPTGCPDCAERGEEGRLEVVYDPAAIDRVALPFDDAGAAENSLWRYRELLPLLGGEPVTLGEGWTPITKASELSESTGADVFLKNETCNPTWSFKDRLYSLLLSNVATLAYDRVAVSSTGNGGASAAAYAARAGFDRTVVVAPHECEPPLRRQIMAYGAALVITEFEKRSALVAELVDRGWYPAKNGLHYSPEGYKTIAFELVEQLEDVPDVVVFPAGIGDGLYGIWKGFTELEALGVIDRLPRMIGAQTADRSSLVNAVESVASETAPDTGPIPNALSVAGTYTGQYTLDAVRESGGTGVAIEQAQADRAVRETGRDGIFVEPSTALAPAAVRSAIDAGAIRSGETVVCIATGAGVKWPAAARPAVGEPAEIEPTLDALRAAVPFAID